MSFVLVLPTLPVIAITGILYKFRLYSAICCNAFIVSSTIIIAESVYFFIISSGISTFSNIKHFAPFFNTSSYNSFPFTLAPFIKILFSDIIRHPFYKEYKDNTNPYFRYI